MEKFAELISILLQHSQRFLNFWNFQSCYEASPVALECEGY